MYCPKCGSHTDNEEAKFCGNCGALLKNEPGSQNRDTQENLGKLRQGEYQAGQNKGGKNTQKKKNGSLSRGTVLIAGGVMAALAVAGIVIFACYFLDKKNEDSVLQESTEETGSLPDLEEQEENVEGNGETEGEEEKAMADSSETEAVIISGWQQNDGKWYYYDDQGTMMTDTWVENYYVGPDGAMQVHTLTSDGYWLGEDGLASEEKRIYGKCLFAPVSYTVDGDQVLITGYLCDSGYASQEYIDSLEVGDTIMRPDDYDRVCEFNTESVITNVSYEPCFMVGAEGEAETLKTVYVYTLGSPDQMDSYIYYRMNSAEMVFDSDDSMPEPLYRIIQKDAVLVCDRNVNFESMGQEYTPASLMDFLERCTQGGENTFSVIEIGLTGNHIDWAKDVFMNYAG